ncbi:hypothetical protein LJC60_00375 [Ruminococcaceae bacterium OttesenSCG-928-D13]|nr:hypothetical protein [Ruminococcaceae bacterium OttesenSCG-928-D13]
MQKTAASKANRVVPVLAIVVAAGVFALYTVAVGLSGGSVAGVFLYPLGFGVLVVLPGLWLSALALPKAALAVRLVAAVPLGGLLLMLVFTTLGSFAPVWLCGLPSALLGLGWAFLRLRDQRSARMVDGVGAERLPAKPRLGGLSNGAWLLVMLLAAALFLYIFSGVFTYARPANGGNRVYSQDLLWSVGNAASAQFGSPVRDIRTAGGILHYHYFSDVLGGLVGLLCGQNAWDSICYYGWPIWCALLCAALYLLAKGFGTGPYAALIVPAGVLFGHTSWNAGYSHVFTNMNGVMQSNFFFAAALLVLQQCEAGGFKSKRALAALLGTLTALIWGKSTVGVLLVCALLAAFLVDFLLRKKPNLWLLSAAGGGAAIFGLLWFLIYRQAINNLLFQPSLAMLVDALKILWERCLPALVLYLISLVYSLVEFKKLGVTALVVNAIVPGGIAAYALFNHYSFSQSYFLLAAVFCMWICAGRVASRFFDGIVSKKTERPMAGRTAGVAVLLLCALGFASTVYYAAPSLRVGVQSALRCLHLRPDMPLAAETITRDDYAAARWLADNMARDEVFATNRNAKVPEAAEGVFHYYTAESQRQAFVESWRYAMDYSLDYHLLRHNLEQVSDGIFAAESFEQATQLARENGISVLLVHLPSGGHPFEGAAPAFESETVLIYKV